MLTRSIKSKIQAAEVRYPHKVESITKKTKKERASERRTGHTGSHNKQRRTIIKIVLYLVLTY